MDPFPSTSRPVPEELLAHASWLRRLARALTLDEASADDLVQDTLGAAITARRPIRDLRAFLGGVLRRRSAELRRGELRRRRREEAHAQERATTLPGADRAAERVETLRILLEELQRLPMAQRDTLTLRFVEGLEPLEIARRAGLAPATVRAHLSRGLVALRARLDRRLGGRSSWTAALLPWIGRTRMDTPATTEPGSVLAESARSAVPHGARAAAISGVTLMSTKSVALALVPLVLLGLWLGLERATEPGVARMQGPAERPIDAIAPHARRASLTAEAPAASAPRVALPPASAASAAQHRVEGVVVDVLTGEAVPSIELSVSSSSRYHSFPHPAPTMHSTSLDLGAPPVSSRSARAWSDASGAFSSDVELEPSEVSVVARDGHGDPRFPARATRHAFPFQGPLEVRVGPTFRFATRFPEGIEASALIARLLEKNGSRPGAPSTSVRPGALPWVRFSPAATEQSGDGPWTLEVSDEEGLWQATAEVRRKLGIEPQPLALCFAARGALRFTVSRANGARTPLAILDLDSAVDGPVRRVYLERAQDEHVVQGHAGLLEPGPYRWRAGAQTGEVEVVAGRVVAVPIEMACKGVPFDLEVELDTSAVEDFDPSFGMHFVVMDTNDLSRSLRLEPEPVPGGPAGRWRLRIVDLPAGQWNLVPAARFSKLRWTPECIRLEPGSTPPMLVARHRGPEVEVRVTVRDAGTGEPLPDATAAWSAGGPDYAVLAADAAGVLTSPALALDEESHLIVRAPGFRMASQHLLPAEDGVELEVLLEPGWSSLVRVVRSDGLDGVRAVEVLVEGALAGRTDDRGLLEIQGAAPPERIELGTEAPEVLLSPFDPPGVFPPDPLTGWTFIVRDGPR